MLFLSAFAAAVAIRVTGVSISATRVARLVSPLCLPAPPCRAGFSALLTSPMPSSIWRTAAALCSTAWHCPPSTCMVVACFVTRSPRGPLHSRVSPCPIHRHPCSLLQHPGHPMFHVRIAGPSVPVFSSRCLRACMVLSCATVHAFPCLAAIAIPTRAPSAVSQRSTASLAAPSPSLLLARGTLAPVLAHTPSFLSVVCGCHVGPSLPTSSILFAFVSLASSFTIHHPSAFFIIPYVPLSQTSHLPSTSTSATYFFHRTPSLTILDISPTSPSMQAFAAVSAYELPENPRCAGTYTSTASSICSRCVHIASNMLPLSPIAYVPLLRARHACSIIRSALALSLMIRHRRVAASSFCAVSFSTISIAASSASTTS